MGEYYILNGREPKPVSWMEWGRWLETNHEEKTVKQEIVGERWVSTIFLGLDHRFGDAGPPLLFETMVFPSQDDSSGVYCDRCSTYDEAEAMHEKACQWVRDGEPDNY